MIMPAFLQPRGVYHEIYMIYSRQVEALRRKELEMVVDLREQLEQKKDSEEREESLELEPGTGERRKSGVPTLTEGSGWQMGSRQFVAGNEIA